jgi:transposase
MSRRQKDPLRAVTAGERSFLVRLSRSQSQPAAHVARAKTLLMVAEGHSYTAAARTAGYRVGDTVAHLVSRFNVEGLNALEPRHGGGTPASYGVAETERILAKVRRMSEHQGDGTTTWSLSLLKQALRQAPDGLPHVSTSTIRRVLHEAGYSWQKNRGWCETGQAKRKRKVGTVTVIDPDAVAKNLIGGAASDQPGQIIEWPEVTAHGWNAHPTPLEWAVSARLDGSERESDDRH